MQIINEDSPAPLRLAGYLFVSLESREKYRPLVLTSWVKVFESLLQETGLDFDSCKAIVRFAVKENEWTVDNLRIARDPAVSLRKQWEAICLRYDANIAVKRARERKSWKHGACPTCDEVESNYGNPCDECAKQELLKIIDRLWFLLGEYGFIREGTTSDGKPAWFIGRKPDEAHMAAPTKSDLKEYMYQMCLKPTTAMATTLDLLLPENERLYMHREAFNKEDLDD